MSVSEEERQNIAALEEKHGRPLSRAILTQHQIAVFVYRLYEQEMHKNDILPSPMRTSLPTPSPTPSIANRSTSGFRLPATISTASTSLTAVGDSSHRHPSPTLSFVSSVPETITSLVTEPSSDTCTTYANHEAHQSDIIGNTDDFVFNAAYRYLDGDGLVFREDRTGLSTVPGIRWAQRGLRWYKVYRSSGDLKKSAWRTRKIIASQKYKARLKKHRECAMLCASDLEEKAELILPGVKGVLCRSLRSGRIRK